MIFTIPAMNDNINPVLNGFLVERRSKCAVDHGNQAKTLTEFTELFKIYQGHGWITRCFTIQNLKKKITEISLQFIPKMQQVTLLKMVKKGKQILHGLSFTWNMWGCLKVICCTALLKSSREPLFRWKWAI